MISYDQLFVLYKDCHILKKVFQAYTVVRVAGYSAFFVELDKDIQDEIISRTMQCV